VRALAVAVLVALAAGCASGASSSKPRTVSRPSYCAGGSYLECTRQRDRDDTAARDLRRIRKAEERQSHELRSIRRTLDGKTR
jgi:hypothetical protein